MISTADLQHIRNTIFDLISFKYNGEIIATKGDRLIVYGDVNEAEITYSDKAELCRGLFLLAKELSSGKTQVSIQQKRHFLTLGVMPQLSYGTLRLKYLKKYIAYAASVGMNSLLLYVEDCFELPGYPYFGYMSGKYSKEEMK